MSVTLLINSGRGNPRWTVSSGDANFEELKQRLNKAKTERTNAKKPSGLGYNGFLVKDDTMSAPVRVVGPETVDFQKLLLESCPKDKMPEGNRERVLRAIESQNVNAGR